MTGVPALATISLDASGGGVAVVARLLRDVLHQRWGGNARLVQLIHGRHAQPTFLDKVQYALSLAALQARGQADWLLYSHVRLAKPLLGMPRAIRRPYAVFLHGIEAWCELPEGQVELLASAEVRISNSAYTAARVMAAHPAIGPVHACPLALPGCVASRPEAFASTSASALGPSAVLVVGRMSALERYKGHDELIDAWPAVVARVPEARLIFVGDGDDAPRLKEKARHTAASSSIVFAGFVSDTELGELYEQAALFALPSRAEGFGLVYLEAMSHRLACIGSIHDAARDVIVDGDTGLLVDQDREGELASALVALLQDRDRRRSMGERGHLRFHHEFTPQRFTDRLLTLLDSSVATSTAA
jgi:phosphatidylinositol alpha-1,6-mannosyltransferase